MLGTTSLTRATRATRVPCCCPGVSEINADSDVGTFFATHIQPELQGANIDQLPVVKASCIKFVCTFRNQLPKAGLVALLPIVANFLRSTVYVWCRGVGCQAHVPCAWLC